MCASSAAGERESSRARPRAATATRQIGKAGSAPHRADQDVGNLRTAELLRWALARREHLAHLRAGERYVLGLVVRARLRRRHAVTDLAVEGVVEEERRDADLLGREVVEDVVRVVGAVVRADARMIAADDEVRAAVVLANEGVEDRLARAGVPHVGGQHGEDGAVLRIVLL